MIKKFFHKIIYGDKFLQQTNDQEGSQAKLMVLILYHF